MVDNYFIAEQFSLLSKLMDIHGENSFKSRSYGAAAFNIEKMPTPLHSVAPEELSSIKGIGDSVARKVAEILQTGKLSALDEIISKTPTGVIEMLNIKGLGPKKISTIWKEMEIESIGELLYACNENRLSLFKGFGEKTQKNVQEAIEFYMGNQGSFLYAEVEAIFPGIQGYLEKSYGADKIALTGAYRSRQITIDGIEFLVSLPMEHIRKPFQTAFPPETIAESEESITYKLKNGLRLTLHANIQNLPEKQFHTTGSPAFRKAFLEKYPKAAFSGKEEDTFSRLDIPFIEPFLRESDNIDRLIDLSKPGTLISEKDIRGIIHSHSNWSDGVHTIEEMAKACIAKGLEYLVISDHSKSAAYAGGLSEEKIREQHRYIDELNHQLAPFRIFKSIECDILGDGSLDYSDSVLSTFDLVIASVHSNLKMSQEKAMMRLLKAIANPYTTILGHMTGRLLLSRNGYPVNHEQIIEACHEHQVVIELNAHPRRLDIDWQWIEPAVSKGVLISIDPDAHAIEGFDDCRFGVLAAQKGGLKKENNLSSFTLKEFEDFLMRKK